MKKILHRANTRGKGEHGWLSTRYSFSFSDWYDPSRMGFGALRVLNDDIIAPASGFPMHGHKDMEIITIVTKGSLTHRDSLGNIGHISEGEVQVMSAGTGVVHSEYNTSATEPLTLFQLWIETGNPGAAPRYGEAKIPTGSKGDSVQLVGPEGSTAPATILQNASILQAFLTPHSPFVYRLQKEGRGIYIFVIDGTISAAEETLGARDAVGVSDTDSLEIIAVEPSQILLIEVPL